MTFSKARLSLVATFALILGMALGPAFLEAQSNTIVAAAAGTITTSNPLIGAQTWNAGGVSFMGLQLNITETASAAGSHYLDINGGAGGVTSEFFVAKGGAVTALGGYSGTKAALAAGTLLVSTPNTVTQTWNDGAVTFAGLTMTITETADAAASTYINILGGAAGTTAEWSVIKGGATSQLAAATIAATTNQILLGTTNVTTLNAASPAASATVDIGTTAGGLASAADCGTTTTCSAAAAVANLQERWGTVALSSATPSVATVTGLTFTSNTSYVCTATPEGTTAAIAGNGIAVSRTSGTTLVLTGPDSVTTVVHYRCIGT